MEASIINKSVDSAIGKSVCLVSGGIDSKVLLGTFAWDIGTCITFDCNGNGEVKRATEHVNQYNKKQVIVSLPHFDSTTEYPMRNLIFLSHAISEALKVGAKRIYYATHYPGERDKGRYYTDCSPQFVHELNEFLKMVGVRIETPFLKVTLKDIIGLASQTGIDLSDTQVCNYKEGNCGLCPKCVDAIEELRDAKSKSYPHFNMTLYGITDVEARRNIMTQWLPLREARIYHNNKCQKNCDFCSYGYSKEAPYESTMSMAQWNEAFQKFKDMGIKSLMFSGKEPLFDKDIFPLILMGNKLGFETHINTNGIGIPKYRDYLLRFPPHRMIISLNYEDTYKILGYVDSEIMSRMKVQPYVVVLPKTVDELPTLLKKIVRKGITDVYIRFAQPSGFSVEMEQKILNSLKEYPLNIQTPVDYLHLEGWEHYNDYVRGRAIVDGNIEYTFVHNFCEAYYRSLTVLHTGDIVGCAKHTYNSWRKCLSYSIGNINDLTPEEIIERCKERIMHTEGCLKPYTINTH